jgi:hypothetical protein
LRPWVSVNTVNAVPAISTLGAGRSGNKLSRGGRYLVGLLAKVPVINHQLPGSARLLDLLRERCRVRLRDLAALGRERPPHEHRKQQGYGKDRDY